MCLRRMAEVLEEAAAGRSMLPTASSLTFHACKPNCLGSTHHVVTSFARSTHGRSVQEWSDAHFQTPDMKLGASAVHTACTVGAFVSPELAECANMSAGRPYSVLKQPGNEARNAPTLHIYAHPSVPEGHLCVASDAMRQAGLMAHSQARSRMLIAPRSGVATLPCTKHARSCYLWKHWLYMHSTLWPASTISALWLQVWLKHDYKATSSFKTQVAKVTFARLRPFTIGSAAQNGDSSDDEDGSERGANSQGATPEATDDESDDEDGGDRGTEAEQFVRQARLRQCESLLQAGARCCREGAELRHLLTATPPRVRHCHCAVCLCVCVQAAGVCLRYTG